jgi:autotransporter strand-loop-strand O-heptosyltransferase
MFQIYKKNIIFVPVTKKIIMNILFLAPHLSTGGMPQFLLKRIESLIESDNKIFVVEYECLSDQYVVQRNKIINLIGKENFFTLDDNKMKLIDIIKENKIQIVHIDHEAEGLDFELMKKLYSDVRKYRIIETCHNVSFNPKNKIFIPDGFAFCSPYHVKTFEHIQTKKELIMYPLEINYFDEKEYKLALEKLKFDVNKTNVLSVGLWCDNKNQAKVFEIAEQYPDYDFHIVGNQAINFANYWKPLMERVPKNVKVWGEREDVRDFMILSDIFLFPSKQECNPIVLREAISHELTIYANDLPQYCGIYDHLINSLNSKLYQDEMQVNFHDDTYHFKKDHEDLYELVLKSKVVKQPKETKVMVNHNFVDGAFVEVFGKSNSSFLVEFFVDEKLVYKDTIRSNSWARLSRKYYTEYNIKVTEIKPDTQKSSELIFEKKAKDFLKGQRVMISFESSSLGDTLACLPYCDEFQKKHDCVLFVSTFKNFLFDTQYPNINFIEPAEVVQNLYAKYDLGWFYDNQKEPVLPNTIPLQQTATNILGLSFSEIKPKLNFTPKVNVASIDKKYVCIAPDSTSGCKEWKVEYWQKIVDFLIKDGYDVVNVSLNSRYNLENVFIPSNLSLDVTKQIIHYSEFFIGLSSGLSWLAWALNKHVYMIANFTKSDHEFQSNCTRITNEYVCNGCWNNKNFKFDKGDWNWCPIWKGYEKQFECQNSIYSYEVASIIKTNLKDRVHN